MEQWEFWRRYFHAKNQALVFALEKVSEQLPTIHMPFVSFPMGGPSADLAPGEKVFKRDDIYRKHGHGHPHSEDQVLGFYWRNGLVPAWIDIRVFSANKEITVFEISSSDVFTRFDDAGASGFPNRALWPWHAFPPMEPPGWKGVEASGKFSLNWHLPWRRPN